MATGKASAVLAKLEGDFARIKCAEPENSIKEQIHKSIVTALGEYPASSAVQIEASGSQTPGANGGFINSATMKITPLWGFVE